jgi:hypothetical protein
MQEEKCRKRMRGEKDKQRKREGEARRADEERKWEKDMPEEQTKNDVIKGDKKGWKGWEAVLGGKEEKREGEVRRTENERGEKEMCKGQM